MKTLELESELTISNTQSEFTAHYKNYVITGEVECEISIDQETEEEVGIMSDYYQLDRVTFWYLEVVNNDEETITLNKQELQSCKNDIENQLDTLVQEF